MRGGHFEMKIFESNKAQLIELFHIKTGMILAENIFIGGKLLLGKGTVTKSSYKDRLRKYGISKILVYKQESLDVVEENPIENFYKETYKKVMETLKEVESGKKITISHIFPIIESILEVIFSNQENMLLLTGCNHTFDIYYYSHCMNVCIYSLITGKAMGLSYEEILILGIGALLHDIGKSKIPNEILDKKDRLSYGEFEEIKKHPQYGLELSKNILQIPDGVGRIIVEHHERCDGSGYPRQLKGREIYKLSKIAAIADIYDALTTDRIYKKKVLPHEAAEYLLAVSCTQLDDETTKIFLENIAVYPKGCQVLLNTNEIGVVTDPNYKMSMRPKLKLLTDQERNPLKIPWELDMQKELSVFITDIFN